MATISFKDRVLLLDALETFENGYGLLIDACELLLPWRREDEAMCSYSNRALADAMYLVLYSEGWCIDGSGVRIDTPKET